MGTKIVEAAADNLFPWQAEESARSDAGLAKLALIIGQQNGDGRMVNNGPEEQFKLLRTVFRKPTIRIGRRGHGGQNDPSSLIPP